MTAAGPVLRTPSQVARRQRILDAALALLLERDYERIQVRDVAEAAHVALGTLYRYFPAKEQLFAEVLVGWAAKLRTNISRHPLRGSSDAERLTEAYHRAVRAFQRQPSLARLVATLETSSDPLATETLARLGEVTNDAYLDALREVDRETAQRIVNVVNAVLASSLRSWVAHRVPVTRVYDDLAEAITLLLAAPAQMARS